jgi:hypothetical protein
MVAKDCDGDDIPMLEEAYISTKVTYSTVSELSPNVC